ncbi:MAG: hypothetical protein QOJ34_523, partial [Pseudonocardiales bacterium]|nr:hypothetical protein [Pseudonocardiales bacterium]
MTNTLTDTTRVSDLRGATAPAHETAILEDPTGRRRRRLRVLGRFIAVLMTIWVVALLLGGIGITPVPGIPLVRALKPPAAPPVVDSLPKARPPSRAELTPARPAAAGTTPSRITHKPPATVPAQPPRRRTPATSNGKGPTVRATPVPKNTAPASSPPGQGKAKPTPNGNANGQSTSTTTGTSTTPGKSGTSPGHTRTTTTTPATHG